MTILTQTRAVPKRTFLQGALLVSGTCIGGGMLAMPIQTAEAGFVVSTLVLFASWLFMSLTGLLLVEATLWFKNRAHFSSMAQTLFGTPGKILCLVIYLFMNCASLVAYISGGAILINHWIQSIAGVSLGYAFSCVFFTVAFGSVVYIGASFIGKVNGWFMVAMGVIYCYLVGSGIMHMQGENLAFRPAWIHGLSSFPLIFAAFSYQMIVPSICSYLDYDVKALRKSILLGTSAPFLVYFLWLLMIHGMIPFEGVNGLKDAYVNGRMIVEPLKAHYSSMIFFMLIDGFAFIALVTSYLGLSLALFDFVRDLFKDKWKNFSQNKITALSLTPSLLLAIAFPNALLDFLDLSGGFGDAILSCLIPVGMVWIGRYQRKYEGEYQVFGGKSLLLIAGCFSFAIFLVQWLKLFGVL